MTLSRNLKLKLNKHRIAGYRHFANTRLFLKPADWARFVLLTLFLPSALSSSLSVSSVRAAEARAIFAGGCFWCMEQAFEALDGVSKANSGYIGGTVARPTYAQVSQGNTGHTEAIEVLYDSEKLDYTTLLDAFWRNVDPVDGGGQFCDRGSQYRSGIFPLTEQQFSLAQSSKEALDNSKLLNGRIQTEITYASSFYPAEEYHQDYYLKNPRRYKLYKWNCGRKRQLDRVWGSIEKLPFLKE